MVQRNQSDALEIELIRTLFASRTPPVIMSVGFVLSGFLIVRETGDALSVVLLTAGAFVSVARLGVTFFAARVAAGRDISLDQARSLQRHFTVVYISFALILGLFGDHTMRQPHPQAHMLMICLLTGYAAGVAQGVGLRPRIAVPSMMIAVIPGIIAMLTRQDIFHYATAAMSAAFLVGGAKSVLTRHRHAVRSIGRRLAFASLARRDSLTDLPNRLALREWYDERVTFAERGGLVAVHYLDLNGFKPVNDTFGHPVGDALLVAVGKRISRIIREGDLAARLGGDEFAVVQCDIAGEDEACALAERLAEAIARPFGIETQRIEISTCIGYVTSSDRSVDLDELLGMADQALYTSKRGGCRIVSYQKAQPLVEREAA